MSNYITSFVDPLFRQARRFSEGSQSSSSQFSQSEERQRVSSIDRDGLEGDIIRAEISRERRETWAGDTVSALHSRSHLVWTANSNDRRNLFTMDHSERLEELGSLSSVPAPHVLTERGNGPLPSPRHDPSEPVRRSSSRSTVHDIAASADFEISPTNEERNQNTTVLEDAESDSPVSGGEPGVSDSTLPADDGMSTMRRRIQDIQKLEISSVEKARLVHSLMTENYRALRSTHHTEPTRAEHSSRSPSKKRSCTPISPRSKESFDQLSLTPASMSSNSVTAGPYYLTSADLEPTYVPKRSRRSNDTENALSIPNEVDSDIMSDEDEFDDGPQLGCEHYSRNVKLQCYTCKRWYTCRFCHDAVEEHSLERGKTEYMLCMLCKTPQLASQWCKSCGAIAASYYCSICKLWDNDSRKAIYHCADCGICRRGQGLGKDFIHCKTCAACISISIAETHRCIESSIKCDCPICGDYMFTSPESVILMRCGHSMHEKCYAEYQKTSYRCPICSKTILNMEAQFRNLDRTIESQPMPPEFRDTLAIIHCNDCRAKSLVKFHWLGLKCGVCESYNTNQLQLQSNHPGADQNAHSTENGAAETIVNSVTGLPASHPMTSQETDPMPLAEASSPSNCHLSPSSAPQRRNVLASSPRITNYFGISSRRDSTTQNEKGATASNSSNDDFWGLRLLSVLGNLDIGSEDGDEDESEDEEDEEEVDEAEELENNSDEDGDDDGDAIDIFGHR